MSTHYIEEAERLADTVTVMAAGRAVAAGPPKELILEHAGRTVLEVYGPPEHLRAVEAAARQAGHDHRRTGTSVAILRADDLGGSIAGFDGHERVANLEDVFVKLTGEEVA
jgi:lipooligosaccharide transport system ATP-binding protein